MATLTLMDLGPVIAAVVGPMLAAVMVMMRYQHQDSTKTRQLINDARDEARTLNNETRQLIADARDEARKLITDARGEARTLNDETSKSLNEGLKEVVSSLADARERLARIEGHLGIGMRPSTDAGDSEADAA